MGYFTNNIESFDNLNDPKLDYVYGELIDYKEDCEGHYYIDGEDIDDYYYYEGRYRCVSEWEDDWGETDYIYIEENYAFYIPENSIPQEKREWYKNNATNNVR